MKILLITEFFPDLKKQSFSGGVEARTFFTARNLKKTDKVMIICRKTNDLKKSVKKGNIFIYPCGFSGFNVSVNFLSVFERLIFMFTAFFRGLKLDFDLVEGSNFVTYLPAYFLGLSKKKPKIAWYADVFMGNWINYFGLTGVFGEIIERISLKLRWSKVIALSKTTKNKLVKAGINENKIDVVYGGVDYKNIVHQPSTINHQPSKIICISRLVKYKRVEDLIKAFELLTKKYSGLYLEIVGQGPEEKKLRKFAKESSMQNKVKFLKNLERKELLKHLKQSFILCLPSVAEGFGLVTIEAAACGIPYVISDINVNREVTQNGQGGLLFKKKNTEDLKNKIEKLLTDKNLYTRKQKEGIKLSRNYDWNIIVEQTKRIYSEVILSLQKRIDGAI